MFDVIVRRTLQQHSMMMANAQPTQFWGTPGKKRPLVTLTTPRGTPLRPKHTRFSETPLRNALASSVSKEVRDLEAQLEEHLKIVEDLKKKIAETSQKDLGGKIAEPEAAQEALNDTSFIEDLANLSLRESEHVVTVYYDHNDVNYHTIERVGKGSYGVCYLVEHKRTGERLCRKVVDLCQKNLDMEDARSECSFLNRVRHPNVLSLFDLHINPEMELSIYMEYCPWSLESLRLVRTKKGVTRERLEVDTVLHACYQALHGLDYLKNFGRFTAAEEDKTLRICHCDIKNDNLLINFDGRVKISDFGLAVPLKGDEKITDEIERGSEAYMAPEVSHTEPYWEACDVYSLGVSCYEMLTGKLPSGRSKDNFWDKTRGMLKMVIPNDDAKLDRVHRLLQTMMEPDPDQRATPIKILDNAEFFAGYDMESSEIVMLEALRKGEELHQAYLKFKEELKHKGAEEDLEVSTEVSSSEESGEEEDDEDEDGDSDYDTEDEEEDGDEDGSEEEWESDEADEDA